MTARPPNQIHDADVWLEAILESTQEFLGVLSPDGILLRANRASLDSVGATASEVQGKPFWETPWWSHSVELQERLKRAITQAAAGSADRFEATHPTPAGILADIDFQITPMNGPDGATILLVAEGRDISEHKATAEALREGRHRLDRAIQGTRDGLWDWNITTGREWWSDEFWSLLGFETGEIEATYDNFLNAVHPDDQPRMVEAIRAHLDEGVTFDIEYRLRVKNGSYRWFRGRGKAERDAGGQPLRMSGTIQDVDARRRSDATLRQRDEQLNRLLEAAIRLNTKLDVEPVLQEVADSARDVIGCRYAALGVLNETGDGLENFVVSGITRDVIEQMGALPSGKGVLGLLLKDQKAIRLADLKSHPSSVGFPPGHPVMNTFLGVPVIGRDGPIGNLYFTEKVNGEEFDDQDESAAKMLAAEAAVAVQNARLLTRLRTLQVSRDRFYAMVNHELRNALTGVYGWAEMFVRSYKGDPPRAAVETIESAEYALELLNDLLDLSRLDADSLEAEIAHADAAAIVRDAVRVVQPAANDADVLIDLRGADEDVPCRTDAKRIRQTIINLLRNAVRHSGSKDVIVSLSVVEPNSLRFDVIDHGEGIKPDQQAIIFDAYKRADSQSGGGTGLGLTLCRRLARLLGGEISVTSQYGHGAQFTVIIARDLSAPAKD